MIKDQNYQRSENDQRSDVRCSTAGSGRKILYWNATNVH